MTSPSASAPKAQAEKFPAQTPKPHQLEAKAFCWTYKRVILANDMGTGKTLPAIQASEGRTIIVCPSTTKGNWPAEILREKPDARVLVVSGTVPSPIEPDVDFVNLNYDIADLAANPYRLASRYLHC